MNAALRAIVLFLLIFPSFCLNAQKDVWKNTSFHGPVREAIIVQVHSDSLQIREAEQARFIFDEKGRPLEQHFEGKLYEKHIYNANVEIVYTSGRLERYIESFEKESALTTAPPVQRGYTYQPDQSRTLMIERNQRGQIIAESTYGRSKHQLVLRRTFNYDKKGRLIATHEFTSDGKEVATKQFAYNTSDSLLVETTERAGDSKNKVAFTYTKDHRKKSKAFFDDGQLVSCEVYTYTLVGDSEIVHLNDTVLKRERIVSKTRRTAKGEMIECIEYRIDGTLMRITSFEQLGDTHYTLVREFNYDGTSPKTIRYTLDKYGNWIERKETYALIIHRGPGKEERTTRTDTYLCKITYTP